MLSMASQSSAAKAPVAAATPPFMRAPHRTVSYTKSMMAARQSAPRHGPVERRPSSGRMLAEAPAYRAHMTLVEPDEDCPPDMSLVC